jgi:hypothetical protein
MALNRAQKALRTIHLSNTQNASSFCTTNALPRQCKEQLLSSVEGNALFTRTKRTNTLRRPNWRAQSTHLLHVLGLGVKVLRFAHALQLCATPRCVNTTDGPQNCPLEVCWITHNTATCFGFSVSSHIQAFRNKQRSPPYPNTNEMSSVCYELYT